MNLSIPERLEIKTFFPFFSSLWVLVMQCNNNNNTIFLTNNWQKIWNSNQPPTIIIIIINMDFNSIRIIHTHIHTHFYSSENNSVLMTIIKYHIQCCLWLWVMMKRQNIEYRFMCACVVWNTGWIENGQKKEEEITPWGVKFVIYKDSVWKRKTRKVSFMIWSSYNVVIFSTTRWNFLNKK